MNTQELKTHLWEFMERGSFEENSDVLEQLKQLDNRQLKVIILGQFARIQNLEAEQ